MNLSVRARLSTMMALIYAVQGAWWPMLALHLGDLGLDGRERGWIFAAYPDRRGRDVARGRGAGRSAHARPARICRSATRSAVCLPRDARPGPASRRVVVVRVVPRLLAHHRPDVRHRDRDELPQPGATRRGIRPGPAVGHGRLDGGGMGRLRGDGGRGIDGPARGRVRGLLGRRGLLGGPGGVRAVPPRYAAAGSPGRRPQVRRGRAAAEDALGGGAARHVVRREPDHPARLSGDAHLLRTARPAAGLGGDGRDARSVARGGHAGVSALALPPGWGRRRPCCSGWARGCCGSPRSP